MSSPWVPCGHLTRGASGVTTAGATRGSTGGQWKTGSGQRDAFFSWPARGGDGKTGDTAGLRNIGNSCYHNAVINVLAGTFSIARVFGDPTIYYALMAARERAAASRASAASQSQEVVVLCDSDEEVTAASSSSSAPNKRGRAPAAAAAAVHDPEFADRPPLPSLPHRWRTRTAYRACQACTR